MLSGEWRCSWSSADRRCANFIWVINNLIAYYSASYIRDLTVVAEIRMLQERRISSIGFVLLLRRHHPEVVPSMHYSDVLMGAMASQITSLRIFYSTVYSGTDQRTHQSSTSLAFVREILPLTSEFPTQMASNAENVPIWWRHPAWGFCPWRIQAGKYNINTLRPRQNGRYFANDIFKWMFLNENVWFPI